MAKEIGRLSSFGIGIESTPGTAVAPTNWIPTEEFSIKPIVEKANDTNALGIIDEISGSAIVKETTEITAGGILRSQSI